MKRLIISLTIIAIIITVGLIALNTVRRENERLYGLVESVMRAYEAGGADREISALEGYFKDEYVKVLGAFVDDDRLADIALCIKRLRPMLESGCDEFGAECESIKAEAERIWLSEAPKLYRIL